jgi:hypothetical protein
MDNTADKGTKIKNAPYGRFVLSPKGITMAMIFYSRCCWAVLSISILVRAPSKEQSIDIYILKGYSYFSFFFGN